MTYTAGDFGVDDTGAIKISWRTASDSSRPQFTDPKAPNYTTADGQQRREARARGQSQQHPPLGGHLAGARHQRLPAQGRHHHRAAGRPARRLARAIACRRRSRPTFPFKVFADAFATYDFVEVPKCTVARVGRPAGPTRFKAILPTLRRVGQPFRLAVLAEDRWGNVSDKVERTIALKPSRPSPACRRRIALKPGEGPRVIDGLTLGEPGDMRIDLHRCGDGRAAWPAPTPCASSRMPICCTTGAICTGRAARPSAAARRPQYFAFAKHKAFLDIVGHQGNDFQINDAFWAEINRLAAEYDKPGEMVALPGYEWSGNTGMGGDRNVFFATEGRPIRRSSSVLLDAPGRHRLSPRATTCSRRCRARMPSSSPTSADAMPICASATTAAWSARSRCTPAGAPSSGCCTMLSSSAIASASSATATTTRDDPEPPIRAPRSSAPSAASPAT